MTSVEVIVPWKETGCPHRAAALDWVLRRYVTRFPDWKVTLAATDGEPWIKARAVNPAVETSTADIVIIGDADCWSEGIRETVDDVAARRCVWAVPYWTVHRFTATYTARVLDGADPAEHSADSLIERSRHPVYPGGGIVALTRRLASDVPLDPRFEGWGGEDIAWGQALRTFGGKPGWNAETLYHLWHPPQDRPSRDVLPAGNAALWRRYHAAYRKPGPMRTLLNETSNEGAQL